MTIPDEVLRIFMEEAESTNYGKVSLGIIRRGKHEHYEIDKHLTMAKEGEDAVFDQAKKTAAD